MNSPLKYARECFAILFLRQKLIHDDPRFRDLTFSRSDHKNTTFLLFLYLSPVREAVRKAEEAAKKAVDESAKHGDNAAELRVAAIKAKLAAQSAIKQRLHRVNKLHPKLKPLRKWARPSKHNV